MMYKKLMALTMLGVVLSVAGVAIEGFEKLKPSQNFTKQLQAKQWVIEPIPMLLPDGWMPMTHRSKGIYRIETNKPALGKQALFLKGDIMLVPGVMKFVPDQHIGCQIKFRARRDTAGTGRALFHVVIYGEKSNFLTTKTQSFALTDKWREYSSEINIPTHIGKSTVLKVAPGVGSDLGCYFDEVEFTFTRPPEKNVKAVAPQVKPALEFDFKGVGGKTEYADKSGNFKVVSECGNFVEEYDSLRSSFGARFRIDCPDNAFGNSFTVTSWMVRSSINGAYRAPFLGRGYHDGFTDPAPNGKFDFSIEFNNFVPEFRTYFGGLTSEGHYFSGNYRYSNSNWVKNDPRKLIRKNEFIHFAAVYDRGTLRTYANGILLAERKQTPPGKLFRSGLPIYLGGARVKGENDNKFSSDILYRNLKIYPVALTTAEIVWDSEQIPASLPLRRTIALTPLKAYYSSDMKNSDPDFRRRMPIVETYLKRKPTAVTAGDFKAKVVGDSRAIGIYGNGKLLPQLAWAQPRRISPTQPVTAEQLRIQREGTLDMAAAGAKLYRMGNVVPDWFWKGPKKYDLKSYYYRMLDELLAVDPDAKVLMVIPAAPPNWWFESYPQEMEYYYISRLNPGLGKKTLRGHGGPFGSDIWINMAAEMVYDVVKEFETGPYAKHILSYHISSGESAEWYWPATFSGPTGYSARNISSFRTYLKDIVYKDDVVLLRKAWQDPDVTFETAEVPELGMRFASENGFFRDTAQGSVRRCIDYKHYINYRTLKAFNAICGAARRAAGNSRLITTYFGYSLYYAGRQSVLFNSGLQFMSEALKSPYVDGFVTPVDYLRRRGGDPGVNIAGYNGSALLHQKIIWREEDLRTHFHTRLEWGRTADKNETSEVILRGIGYSMADMYGSWFIPLEASHGFHQQEVLQNIAIGNAAAEVLNRNNQPSRDESQIALIFDEKSSVDVLGYNADTFSRFLIDGIWGVYQQAHFSGIPFKLYMLEDLADPKMPDFKLYIFLNAYSVTAEQREMIRKKLSKNCARAVWQYAPGYFRGLKKEIDNMRALTGMEFVENDSPVNIGGYKIKPLVTVKPDSGIKVKKTQNGFPVLASKGLDTWSLLPLKATDIARLGKEAGIHSYSAPGDLLLANNRCLMLHTAKAGEKKLVFPKRVRVRNLLTKKDCGNVSHLNLGKLPIGKTILLEFLP